MAAPSYARDEARDKTRSKTYGKTSVEERRNKEVKHIRGMMVKQITKKRRMTRGGHVEKS